jgi:hypothetical protein
MRILSVIVSRVWVNTVSGRTASIYGAAPWTSPAGKAEWEMVSRGFTWEMDNNTIGCGRVPAATREEAEAFMADWNGRLDAAALASLPGMIAANVAEIERCAARVATAAYPAAKRAALRSLKEAKARWAACVARLDALTTSKAA